MTRRTGRRILGRAWRRRAAGPLVLAVLAGSVDARPGTPGPHYFAGSYDRVGRTGAEPPALLDDVVRITPEGQGLRLTACEGDETVLGFGPAIELENLMLGQQGSRSVECLFHNNGYNRPILTCQMSDGGAFTLWPTGDVPLVCAD